MSTDWAHLQHAYGSAVDVPALVDAVADPELAVEAWSQLWSCLCHQGTVYPASFAALPVLADVATGRRPGDPAQAIALAGRIVAGERQLRRPGYCREHYPAAIGQLHRMTQHHLQQPLDAGERDYLYPLEDLLALEGVAVWSECLLPGRHDVICPSCAESLQVDTDDAPPSVRRRDPHASVREANVTIPMLTSVRPAVPADLQPLAARLYRVAEGVQVVGDGGLVDEEVVGVAADVAVDIDQRLAISGELVAGDGPPHSLSKEPGGAGRSGGEVLDAGHVLRSGHNRPGGNDPHRPELIVRHG